MGIEVESINEINIEQIIDKLKALGIHENDQRLQLVRKLSKSPEEYNLQSIRDDKTITPGKSSKNDDLVIIPSAGITVKQNDGKFKYIGTNSTSFSIPVITGLFAMARQVNPKITLEQFSEICKQTATVENGYKVINPIAMIREVNKYKENNKKIPFENIIKNAIIQNTTIKATEMATSIETIENTTDKNLSEV